MPHALFSSPLAMLFNPPHVPLRQRLLRITPIDNPATAAAKTSIAAKKVAIVNPLLHQWETWLSVVQSAFHPARK